MAEKFHRIFLIGQIIIVEVDGLGRGIMDFYPVRVLAVFIGVGAPLQRGAGSAVVGVGPYEFGINEFDRERRQREEQYREALGAQFDAKALSQSLDMLTAQVLSNRALMALEAERLGLTSGSWL